MATVTKSKLSVSTNGKNIPIGGPTSGSATIIHTAVSGITSFDEVWVYASNNSTASVSCSILWGGGIEPDDMQRTILNPYSGRQLVIDGRLINSSSLVRAYASVSGSVNIDGFVNQIV